MIILHMCTKNHNHDVQFLRSRVRQNFWSFWATFAVLLALIPSPLNNPESQNFENIKKGIWICHHFKPKQQKTQ